MTHGYEILGYNKLKFISNSSKVILHIVIFILYARGYKVGCINPKIHHLLHKAYMIMHGFIFTVMSHTFILNQTQKKRSKWHLFLSRHHDS